MRPTTVRVIAPGSKYVGVEMVLEATYGDAVYLRHEGRALCCRRSQVEAVHIQDLDNVLLVTGDINGEIWNQLTRTLKEMYGGWNGALCSGWTGRAGRMSVKFEVGTAAERLAAVAALCEPHGLVVKKPAPEW